MSDQKVSEVLEKLDGSSAKMLLEIILYELSYVTPISLRLLYEKNTDSYERNVRSIKSLVKLDLCTINAKKNFAIPLDWGNSLVRPTPFALEVLGKLAWSINPETGKLEVFKYEVIKAF